MLKRTKTAIRPRYRGQLPDSKALLGDLMSETKTRFGVRLKWNGVEKVWRLADVGGTNTYLTQREAIQAYFSSYGRRYGWKNTYFVLTHPTTAIGTRGWTLKDHAGNRVAHWLVRPMRTEIAATIRNCRRTDSRPSFKRPDTLGFRTFDWHPTKHCLMSPSQHTLWTEPEMRVENWSELSAVRGHAGIHACRLPRGDWRTARRPSDMPVCPILALVERFGKFVLGTEGWRAEWVFIKEILAPDEATARALRRTYPEIPISVAKPGHWITFGGQH